MPFTALLPLLLYVFLYFSSYSDLFVQVEGWLRERDLSVRNKLVE